MLLIATVHKWISCWAGLLLATFARPLQSQSGPVTDLCSVPYTGFGAAIAPGSDHDGDGVPDFFVGAPYAADEQGEVCLISSKSKRIVRRIRGDKSHYGFGITLDGSADFNRDKIPDLLVQAQGCEDLDCVSGCISVINGKDFEVLMTINGATIGGRNGPSSLTPFVDLTDDGIPEVVVGVNTLLPSGNFSRRIVIVDGMRGNLLASCDVGLADYWYLGPYLVLPDVTGDELPEIVVGGLKDDNSHAGRISVLSGKNLDLVFSCVGRPEERDQADFGSSLALIEDVTGDGFMDLMLGCARVYGGSDLDRSGRTVQIFDGKSGSEVRNGWPWKNCTAYGFGARVSGLGDCNDDGTKDFMIATHTYSGSIFVYDGVTGADLFTIVQPPKSVRHFGCNLAAIADQNGDGIRDIAVSEGTCDPGVSYNEIVTVYSGRDGTLLYCLNWLLE